MAGLIVAQPYPNQEFPVGVDFPVSGTAQVWSEPWPVPHPIDSVWVRVDNEALVEADLAETPAPALVVAFSATVRLKDPGEHQITVSAIDDVGGSITEVVAVATTGTPHCRAGVVWNNYTKTQDLFPNAPNLIPHSTCTPASLAGLVASVREAEAANKHVHAFGSKWSFSDCAFTSDYVIDTRHLSRAMPMEDALQRALQPGQDASLLYHVEAGITIRDLYYNLNGLGRALETMGGASGQTLAGAISTGTHGGDKFMAPLADSVVAIHLVGAGGTQYWIEPSPGITDPVLLKANVVPDVDLHNIIYDDATFNACLVSLGCMGVIYAVVLRVRKSYDLAETTVETTWQDFKENAANYLADQDNRFLQVLLNPYKDDNDENFCLLTTRSEARFPVDVEPPSPVVRPTGNVEAVVTLMIVTLGAQNPHALLELHHHGVLEATDAEGNPLSKEVRLAKIVDGILAYAPGERGIMVSFYGPILLEQWPTGGIQGPSYSVMDIEYGQPTPASEPGYSIELHFEAMDENGRLGFVDFIDALIAAVNAAAETFFTGYISLRFTGGPTRAYLGMQQWNQTCSVEIAVLQGVQGLFELLSELFRMGFDRGGLPHWGQQLDLGVQGHGNLYPQYAHWRQVYAKMSNNFATRTFENDLSSRWNLTTPNASIASNALLLLEEEKAPVPIASNALLLLEEEKAPVPIASIVLLLLSD